MAVPLPPSFQEYVETAIEQLPAISVVVQCDAETDGGPDEAELGFSYVPIDPCQGVIAALRTARGERIAREFIDLEAPRFVPITGLFPDPYALKRVSPERFAAALLAAVPPPVPGQNAERIAWMAARLRELDSRYRLTLFVCSILDWPWIRDAFHSRPEPPVPETFFSPMSTFGVDPRTLIFVLGELPYITGVIRARSTRAHARRQPFGRWSQGAGARRPRATAAETSQNRPADHAAPALGLFSLYPQPVARRPPADARPVHADRGRPADGRR